MQFNIMMFNRRESPGSPINPIIGLLIVVLFVVALFMLARFVFTILSWLAPIMIIAALILDYKVVLGYGKWLIDLVKSNALMGIGAIILTVLGFPVVAAFLAGKALLKRNLRKAREEDTGKLEGEYIDFEELEEKPLKLPELDRMKQQPSEERTSVESSKKTPGKSANEYDSLFD